MNYGFTISGTDDGKPSKLFISGLAWEAGYLDLIVPRRGTVKPDDFVPVWERAADAQHVLYILPVVDGRELLLRVVDAGHSYLAGGPAARNRMMRGVMGFTIPEKPPYIFRAELKSLDSVHEGGESGGIE